MHLIAVVLILVSLTSATTWAGKRVKRRPNLCEKGQNEINIDRVVECGYCNNLEEYNCKYQLCERLPDVLEMCANQHTYTKWDVCLKGHCITYGKEGVLGKCETYYRTLTTLATDALNETTFTQTTPVTLTTTETCSKEVETKVEIQYIYASWWTILICMMAAGVAGYLISVYLHWVKQWKFPSMLRCLPPFRNLTHYAVPN
ncbi:uncharacterized protein LOC143453434 [Clavelina lepadiformis]|uniref:uncharacterized protein LOC143453434 n=1 Tax=Clavelina lepadiformis TaxID=159417 RepID=UPI0040423C79